jgi:hypothetical protein
LLPDDVIAEQVAAVHRHLSRCPARQVLTSSIR